MGKWRRSRYSRRRYDPQRYMYQENAYYPEIDGPDSAPDNVPSWEKTFCASIGRVPWRKLLFTRKCMFGHENILNWDDCAGEGAFRNAKERFWAKINGMSCEISLPDPDTYIETVNWNSHIDPELIEEADKAYFNPDLCKELSEPKDCESSDDNPWESKKIESGEDLKCEAWGSLRRATSDNALGNSQIEDNPWEKGFNRESQQGNWHRWRSPDVDNSKKDANPWEQGKNNQWGDPHESYCRGWNSVKSNNFYNNYANKGEKSHFQERRFSNEGRGRNQTEYGRNWNDGCRKRESIHQGGSRFKSSRYGGDDYETSHAWNRGRANKRMHFAGSRY